MERSVKRVAILGAGVVGRALARGLSARGDQVALLSPKAPQQAVPALWTQGDVVTGEGIRRILPKADVVVFAAAGRKGSAADVARIGARQAAKAAADVGARFVLVGPSGATQSGAVRAQEHLASVSECRAASPDLSVVRLPVLFGEDDGWLGAWLSAVETQGRMTVRAGKQPLRPLWTEDAVRLLMLAVDGVLAQPEVEVLGPEPLTVEDAARRVQERLGLKRGLPLGGTKPDAEQVALMNAQLQGPDDWESLGLPDRTALFDFVEAWAAARGR